MKGMEYKDRTGDDELIEKLIHDDQWWFQQKMDGTRVMIDLETLTVTTRSGKPLKHTAATQWIPSILYELGRLEISGTANAILDCELLIGSGELYVFDLINPAHLHEPLKNRVERMDRLPENEHIRVVHTARSAEHKWELLAACRNTEGVVAKNITAPYSPGKRVEHVLKLKNVHSAELVVMQLSERPLSARLGVMTEDGLRTVCRASMIGKDPNITEGDVVEVEYLAWTGTSLLQPRIKRLRSKNPLDCTTEQFSPYSREAI